MIRSIRFAAPIATIVVAIAGFGYFASKNIETGVNEIVEIQHPAFQASLEIEINVGEVVREGLDYILNPRLEAKEELDLNAAELEDFILRYEESISTQEEREFATYLKSQSAKLLGLLNRLIKNRDEKQALVDRLTTLANDYIETILDEDLNPSVLRARGSDQRLLEVVYELEINTHELVSAVRGYLKKPQPLFTDRISDSVADLKRYLDLTSGLNLSADEREAIGRLSEALVEATTISLRIIQLRDVETIGISEVEVVAAELDAYLDDKIQLLSINSIDQVHKDVVTSTRRLTLIFVGVGLLGLLAAFELARRFAKIVERMELQIAERAQAENELARQAETLRRTNVALSESERQIRAVIDTVVDGVIIIDENASIEVFNPACEELFGYVADEVIGQNVKMLMPDQYRHEHDGYMHNYHQTGDRKIIGIGREVLGQRKDKSTFPIELSVGEVERNGRPVYVGIIRDVSDRKLRENELRSARDELELRIIDLQDAQERIEKDAAAQIELAEELAIAKDAAEAANKTKSQFLASMSHEIRTPMTGVMGFADLLLDDNLSAESYEKVNKIKDSTRALLRILNDILDMSKLDAGKVELEYIDFHLPSLIEDVTELFTEQRSGGRAKAIDMVVNLEDGTPVGVNLDPTRLRQVLTNLVGNAKKFTESGTITVNVKLIDKDTRTPKIHFSISDTGIGIRPEAIASLFSDFTQADATITRLFEGSGLGLSICKRLVNLMGGEIGVESEYGSGSTFWFTLPYHAASTHVSPISQRTNVINNYRAVRPLDILVVDDNALNREIITGLITGFGHSHEIAEHGMQAVEKHAAGNFDLILMDVRMPVMSGPDATRMIRIMAEPKCSVPIIALTADAMEEHKKTYLDAGMDSVVSKPIDKSELAVAINIAMGEEINQLTQSIHVLEPEVERAIELANEQAAAAVDDFLKSLGSN